MSEAMAIVQALACGKSRCPCAASARKGEGNTHCLRHEDPKPSLTITQAKDRVLWKCHGGCTQKQVEDALRERGLLPARRSSRRQVVEVYTYGPELRKLRCIDAEGQKYLPWQRKVDGRWRDCKGDRGEPGLYRVDELPRAGVVFVAEGERKVDSLRRLGLAATCPPDGAAKWEPRHAERLKQHYLVILPDNDEPGWKHAEKVAAAHPADRSLTLVLPGLREGEDVYDWLRAGHTKQELLMLTELATCEVCGGPIAPARRGTRERTTCSKACKSKRGRKSVSLSDESVSLSDESVSLELKADMSKVSRTPPESVSLELEPPLYTDVKERKLGVVDDEQGVDFEPTDPAGVSFTDPFKRRFARGRFCMWVIPRDEDWPPGPPGSGRVPGPAQQRAG